MRLQLGMPLPTDQVFDDSLPCAYFSHSRAGGSGCLVAQASRFAASARKAPGYRHVRIVRAIELLFRDNRKGRPGEVVMEATPDSQYPKQQNGQRIHARGEPFADP